MARIHEQLYRSKELSKIDFKEYITGIINELFTSYSYRTTSGKIRLNIDIEDISIRVCTAIYCGLIINELFTNVLKHAFPQDKTGEIRIRITAAIDGGFEIMVSDNGIGIPKEIDLRDVKSIGLQMVNALVTKQLGGSIELNRTKGTEFCIKLKEELYNTK